MKPRIKYEITNIQHPNYPNLFRIKSLRDIPRFNVKKGDLGGYVQYERNLSQEGECWITDNGCVYDNGHVTDDARVSSNARVFGFSRICDDAWVFGEACIYDNAHIYGAAWIGASAAVFGKAQVYGNARVFGETHIFDQARVFGNAKVGLASRVFGNAKVFDEAGVYHARVSGNSHVHGRALVYCGIDINDYMELSGDSYFELTTQIYYSDGVTAFIDRGGKLIVNGDYPDIEHHKTLAKLRLL